MLMHLAIISEKAECHHLYSLEVKF